MIDKKYKKIDWSKAPKNATEIGNPLNGFDIELPFEDNREIQISNADVKRAQ